MLLLLRLLLDRSQLVLQRAREVEVMLLLTAGVFPGHRLWVVLLLLLVLRGCETSCMFLDYLGVLDGCVLVQGLLITCLLTTDTTGQCRTVPFDICVQPAGCVISHRVLFLIMCIRSERILKPKHTSRRRVVQKQPFDHLQS